MNATSAEPRSDTGGEGERGSRAYLLAAVALIAIVATLVMVFGVVHPPKLPSIDSAGVIPPASVAWTQWDDRDNCTALMVARPNGDVDRLTCDENGGDVVAWTRGGVVIRSWVPSGQVLHTLDPTTGELVSSDPAPDDFGGELGSSVSSTRRDGTLVVTLYPSGRELWTVKVRPGYEVRAGALSPDGGWVVMTDSADRLLIVQATGGGPAVWAGGASNAWMAPVWEGTPIPDSVSDPKSGKWHLPGAPRGAARQREPIRHRPHQTRPPSDTAPIRHGAPTDTAPHETRRPSVTKRTHRIGRGVWPSRAGPAYHDRGGAYPTRPKTP